MPKVLNLQDSFSLLICPFFLIFAVGSPLVPNILLALDIYLGKYKTLMQHSNPYLLTLGTKINFYCLVL